MSVDSNHGELEIRIGRVQHTLSNVYGLELGLDAVDFVLPHEHARELLPEDGPRSGVLVLEEGGELWLGLYLDPCDAGDSASVVEETSHWMRLVWNALRGETVSQLQLELQAEIDQYLVHRFEGADPLRHLEDASWADWMDGETRDRYVLAHRTTGRYCRSLERRYPCRADTPRLVRELRSFYRAAPAERLRAG